MKRPSKFIVFLGGRIIGIVVIIVLMVGCVLKPTKLDRNNCVDVAETFAKSLVQNDVKTAKLWTTTQQWDRLDGWMTNHTVFHCPRKSWNPFDENETFGGGGGRPNGAITTTASFGYRCFDKGYYLLVDDIVLQPTEDGCQVIEWKACEIPQSEWYGSNAFKCR